MDTRSSLLAEPPTHSSPGEVVLVDDDAVLRMLASSVLTDAGYQVRECADLEEARSAIAGDPPDVVLLDVQLPDGSGLALLGELRGSELTAAIPVIVITGSEDPDFIQTAMAAGAQDFLSKPFHPVELLARMGAALRLKRSQDDLIRLATHDPLTGLPNRRGLLAGLAGWLAHRARSDEALTIVMFDVVSFKSVNDVFGHDTGDRVLTQIGAAAQRCLRAGDLLGRWGGDEFLAVLPCTDETDARTLVARILQSVSTQVLVPDRLVQLRAGIAAANDETSSQQDLLKAVAAALHIQR